MNEKEKKKTRMFRSVNGTWNPVIGCTHKCKYCWARRLVETKLYKTSCKDCASFNVHTHLDRLIKKRRTILVCSMGDLFCKGCPDQYIRAVLDIIRVHSNRDFILCTKNPARYEDFIKMVPDNCILGTTIETNNDNLVREWSEAPPPTERHKVMARLRYKRKFLSIEPIMEFDMKVMIKWVKDIHPLTCEIGYNNYPMFRLPEPTLEKTRELIENIKKLGISVREKTIRKAWSEKE